MDQLEESRIGFVGVGGTRLAVAGRARVCRLDGGVRVAAGSRRLGVRACAETAVTKRDVDLESLSDAQSIVEARKILSTMTEEGKLKKWATQKLSVRPVSQSELKFNTRLDADSLGLTQKNNVDLKVAFTVVLGGSTFLAVLCQIIFSGDLAYFSSYLVGGMSIVFLAIGSTNPGLLTGIISAISYQFRPEFKERLLAHEAGHFLAGYLCGIPVERYDVNSTTTAVQFFGSEYLREDVSNGQVTREEVDALSVVPLAGPVTEAIQYEFAEGGIADLTLLQALFLRTKPSIGSKQQQDQTRWAALMANAIIKKHQPELKALVAAMKEKKSVQDCIRAIEAV